MDDVFQVAPGYNNPGGFQIITPSPDTDGIQFPRTIPGTGGIVVFDGWQFIDLRFPDMETPDQAVSVFAWFGLSSLSLGSAWITIRLPLENKVSWANYNGIAVRPQVTPFDMYWYKALRIRVRKLVAL